MTNGGMVKLQFGSFAPVAVAVSTTTLKQPNTRIVRIQFGSLPPMEYKVPAVLQENVLTRDLDQLNDVPRRQDPIETYTSQPTATSNPASNIRIASDDGFRTIRVYHPNPYQRSRKITSVQILDAHYVELWEGEQNKKQVTQKKKIFQKPMTKSMKRNARRTQQRASRRINSLQPQTIIQVYPMITTSNSFEVLHDIKTSVNDDLGTNKKPVHERLGAPKRSIYERLGSSTQLKRISVHQRLGPKKPSVFERLGPQTQTQWRKKQTKSEDVTSKLTVHAQLDSANSSNVPSRQVEIMMVDKRSNWYATPRKQNFQNLPQEHAELEQLASREGIQTRRTARAREVLEAQVGASRPMIEVSRHNSPNRMPVMMAGASNPTPEQQERKCKNVTA